MLGRDAASERESFRRFLALPRLTAGSDIRTVLALWSPKHTCGGGVRSPVSLAVTQQQQQQQSQYQQRKQRERNRHNGIEPS